MSNIFMNGEQIRVGLHDNRSLMTLNKFIQFLVYKGVIDERELVEYSEAINLIDRMSKNE